MALTNKSKYLSALFSIQSSVIEVKSFTQIPIEHFFLSHNVHSVRWGWRWDFSVYVYIFIYKFGPLGLDSFQGTESNFGELALLSVD